MKHAGPATFARIPRLLAALRERSALRERRPGVFYLGARAFLHFHDDPGGVFADVRLADEFVRLPVTRREEQLELLDRIDECLAVAESRAAGKRRRQAKRGDGVRGGRGRAAAEGRADRARGGA
jgi:hypothetical protein